MYQLCDHDDLFHGLKATKSYAINLFFYSFSNSHSRLVKTLTSFGSLLSLGLDGNKYFVGYNGCNPYTTC
jgi:hypothetical protein